jgi:hypothetical protein
MAITTNTKGDAMPNNEITPEFVAMTPTEFGDAYGYDAKTVRARMRKITDRADQPGSGGRWNIDTVEFHDTLLADLRNRHGNRRVVSAKVKSAE